MNNHLITTVAAMIAVSGCAGQQSAQTPIADNMNEGVAKSCTASAIEPSSSGVAAASITMSNDGWCAVRTTEKDGQPYLLGLVKTRPEHGRVLIQKAGSQTRIEYTADNRHTGPDRFTVALRSRTSNVPDMTVQVTVAVNMGENTTPAVVAPAAAAPARRATPAARPVPNIRAR